MRHSSFFSSLCSDETSQYKVYQTDTWLMLLDEVNKLFSALRLLGVLSMESWAHVSHPAGLHPTAKHNRESGSPT